MGFRSEVTVFLVVALGAAWAAASPLWAAGGSLDTPLTGLVATAMMFTPTLGVLVVWAVRRTPAREWARETGLGLGPRSGRTFALIAAAWLGVPLLVAAAIALSAGLGLLSLDLAGLSLFRQQLAAAPGPTPDAGTLALIQLVAGPLIAPLINAVPAFGEEWGWRGWLLPRLTELGVWPALLLSGLIWGAWHAPLTLLGYNYPSLGAWAAAMFVGFCALFGVLLGWLRLRSGSVWPATIAHGALNATAGAIFLLGDATAPPNPAIAGITGLVGWALLVVVAATALRLHPVRESEPVR
ncbi:CPBP family intramembrane glutamic endopeptidase [Saccharopolyspora griseoalba]|uniref:CPBP family intramembrane glutamic endopeptidase n=1 Tax=Saccharopolyspora griseoalba TaxID=1431848 RepID=A0ABW2LK21_9PSEU